MCGCQLWLPLKKSEYSICKTIKTWTISQIPMLALSQLRKMWFKVKKRWMNRIKKKGIFATLFIVRLLLALKWGAKANFYNQKLHFMLHAMTYNIPHYPTLYILKHVKYDCGLYKRLCGTMNTLFISFSSSSVHQKQASPPAGNKSSTVDLISGLDKVSRNRTKYTKEQLRRLKLESRTQLTVAKQNI